MKLSTEFHNLKKYVISPAVGTSPFNAWGMSSTPGRGARIPQASWPKNQNMKQKQYSSKFNKDF